MIAGIVRRDEAWVSIKVRGPLGKEHELEAIIDTGYTGSLTLPPTLVKELGLVWHDLARGILADGSECLFDAYEAAVVWDDHIVQVIINEANADRLIGMTLLRESELTIQVRPGGTVTIRELPGSSA